MLHTKIAQNMAENRNRLFLCLGLLLLLGCGEAIAEPEWQTPGDHWYLVQEDGTQHYHSSMVHSGASLQLDQTLSRQDLSIRFQVRLGFARQNSIFSLRLMAGDEAYIFSLGAPNRHIPATRGLAFGILGQDPMLGRPEIHLAENVWHDVELRFHQQTIAIYFNQQQVGVVEDATFSEFSRLTFYNWDGTFAVREMNIGTIAAEPEVATAEPTPEAFQLSVTMSRPPHPTFPAALAIDGNQHTFPFWLDVISPDALAPQPDQEAAAGSCIYTFTFSKPQTVNRVRFIQAEKFPAISYRIYGQPVDQDFELLLVEVDDRSAPGGVWIEHEFDPVKLTQLRFVPLVGFGFGPRPFPAIAHLETYLDSELLQPDVPERVYAKVHLDTAFSINGYPRIHDTVFSIAGVGSLPHDLVERYIEPLNLGVYVKWPFFGDRSELLIPEDPDQPGSFDRAWVDSGQLLDAVTDHWAQRLQGHLELGGFTSMGLITAPPFMRDTDYTPTLTDANRDSWQRLAPPVDAAEWGRWVGHIVAAHNQRSNDAIRWAYIWNEPNSASYLPVPWSEKPTRYVELYRQAAPEIKAINPGLKLAGPVITGGGILGWNGAMETDGLIYWDRWIRPMLDMEAGLMDHLDVHTYRIDSCAFLAEAALVANYAHIQGRPVPAIVSSEGAVGARMPLDYDPIAGRWRYNTLFWADYLLKGLDVPDRFLSQSYFYVWDTSSIFGIFDRHFQAPTRDDYTPQPIYWFYWLVRNLRGHRLHGDTFNDATFNLVAAMDETGNVHAVIQNLKGKERIMELQMSQVHGQPQIVIDYLEFNPESGQVETGSRQALWQDDTIMVPMQPYGLYSVAVPDQKPDAIQTVVERTDYFGDAVFSRLTSGGPLTVDVALPPDFDQAEGAVLHFGTSGIPLSRPAVYMDLRVPVEVTINGHSQIVFVGKNNELPLDLAQLQEQNQIQFCIYPEAVNNPQVVRPPQLYILSTALVLDQRRDYAAFYEEQVLPSAFGLNAPVIANPAAITFSWDMVPNADYYHLRIAKDEQLQDLVVDEVLSESEYMAENLKSNTEYYYSVQAISQFEFEQHSFGRFNLEGVQSVSVSAPAGPPAPVQGLEASEALGQVRLRWQSDPLVDEYVVYRRLSGGEWKQLAAGLSRSCKEYIDQDVTSGKTYDYQVRSRNSLGDGAAANVGPIMVRPVVSLAAAEFSHSLPETFVWNGAWSLAEEMDTASLRALFPRALGYVSADALFSGPYRVALRVKIDELGQKDFAMFRLSSSIQDRDRYQVLYWHSDGRVDVQQRTATGTQTLASIPLRLRLDQWYDLTLTVDEQQFRLHVNDDPVVQLRLTDPLLTGGFEFYVTNMTVGLANIEAIGHRQEELW